MPLRNRDGEIIGTFGITKDISELKEAERRIGEVHRQLLEASRLAGMAEIATNVLHNVGNVLNSVNISAGLIGDRLRASKLKGLGRAVGLMDEHAGDLGGFLTQDTRGKLLPGYLRDLAQALVAEQAAIAEELALLAKSVDHLKEVVATQQSYAGASRVVEFLKFDELLDDALRMNAGALTRHKVEVVKQIPELPALPLDRHRLLQILVNLISNAKHAMSGTPADQSPCITLGAALLQSADGRVLRITVADNGEGIVSENLVRVFAHGFTTRSNGHGFGLHSCAMAAQEMGGTLSAHSPGSGQGATFVLELPIGAQEGSP
jgi:signal transduction histidine kinase